VKYQQLYASGYTLALPDGLTGHAHGDGSLSLQNRHGEMAEFTPAQVEGLAELLRLASGLRSAARRKRARTAYSAKWDDGA
jgi:hypothetical protein